MKQIKSEIESNRKTMSIPMSAEFIDYLSKGIEREGRLSRTEAFLDLVKRQQIIIDQTGEPYIAGSARDFAKLWKWDRDAVSNFLRKLNNLGVLSISSSGFDTSYSITCTINYQESSD